MASTVETFSPRFSAFVESLKSPRYRMVAPFLVILLARFIYHKRQRHLEQLRLHRAINQTLRLPLFALSGSDTLDLTHHHHDRDLLSPMEEWHDVGDGVQAASLVYHPLPMQGKEEEVKNSNVMVLIIPGNPGVPHFYLPLMRELIHHHGRRHEIRCLSQTGHFMPWKNNHRVFTLQEQIAHKLYYLRQRIKENPDLQLIIIGHSIGSYFALKIAAEFPNHITKLVLMQPTITHLGKTVQGKRVLPLLQHREKALKLVKGVEYLFPVTVRRWLVRCAVGKSVEEVLQQASLSLVSRHVMRNVLLMALHEMEQVCELDDELLRRHEDKALFVYSPVDHWVPNDLVQGYQVRFQRAGHRMVPQAHAFMMEPNGSRDMAVHISQWVREILDKAPRKVKDGMENRFDEERTMTFATGA